MARWQQFYQVGDVVEYSVPAVGWQRGVVFRKTRSGIPVVRLNEGGNTWAATRKSDIRRIVKTR